MQLAPWKRRKLSFAYGVNWFPHDIHDRNQTCTMRLPVLSSMSRYWVSCSRNDGSSFTMSWAGVQTVWLAHMIPFRVVTVSLSTIGWPLLCFFVVWHCLRKDFGISLTFFKFFLMDFDDNITADCVCEATVSIFKGNTINVPARERSPNYCPLPTFQLCRTK